MKILALEFSSERRNVAVFDTESTAFATGLGTAEETGGRSTHALRLVEEALRMAGAGREEIERLVVGIGPGSYTGVRTAIALAQGWQIVRGTRILGVSTVEGLAAQAEQLGLRGTINVVIVAQRNEFYLAGYEISDGAQRACEPLRLATLAEVQAKIVAGESVIGPDVNRTFPAGQDVFPSAVILGQLAAGRHDFIPGEKLEPIYLREIGFVKAPPPRVIPGA